MSYQGIRDALASRLGAVSGVYNVQKFHRHHKSGFDDSAFKSLFLQSQELSAWRMTRTAVSNEQCPDSDNVVIRQHSIEIQGLHGLRDGESSELEFQDLVDAVLNDLCNGDRTLGGAAKTHALPQVQRITPVIFYGILAHEAILTLTVEENIVDS